MAILAKELPNAQQRSMLFRHGVTPPHPTAKQSWGAGVGFGLGSGSLVWFLPELGRRGVKLRRHEGPTGGGVCGRAVVCELANQLLAELCGWRQ